ncbi:SOS response-associated peptidase [Corynebacterium poyangense]|uniref:Abasic site processing protein n=1 Tax=Corynebacterium poyangense TaxID=2684405 RepID=A0A7H0SMK9_9CORY|nr:SOS response-associated peptidase [Corynebacterium poyangense]MBZ8176890.1 SOS response-associated peptidase [Corynebacterium poyangense]QNQ89784.1 SOS response-associated peptidase [Corynebacterium poyangense]
MCGRFTLFRPVEKLRESVLSVPGVREVLFPEGPPPPRYNCAPSSTIAAVDLGQSGQAVVAPARWGLIPPWKRDLLGPPLFNARAETVREKPSFREAFATQRCVIPMDGYYEWKDKKPYFISYADGELMWAAALFSTALQQLSVTIITTAAMPPMEWLHHRMPRLLTQEELLPWTQGSASEATQMLHPSPEGLREKMEARRVSSAVGKVSHDDPSLIQPVSH